MGHNPYNMVGTYLTITHLTTPQTRVKEPWLSEAASVSILLVQYSSDPRESQGGGNTWKNHIPARFLSGHFAFGPNKWAKEVKHDPNIFFAGEEIKSNRKVIYSRI